MPTFIPTQNSTQSFSEGKLKMPLVRYNTHWAIKWIIWGTYIYFAKLTKPPDRWLIKERIIGDYVITILSCNHPRTWKSSKPHKYQEKGWIKIPTYLNCEGILCYRHGTYELYQHCSNSWSTTKYLAICSGWAKVKLGGFVGSHCCNTLGVWLPHLHLHFISMSIIHLIYAFVELQHEYATYSNVLVL
jgi:hypothetical protein